MYSAELDEMLPNSYGQVAVYDGDTCAGLTGFWVGSKLWCGRYMELDNVIVAANYRRKGVGQQLFNFMEEKAKDLECSILALDSYTDNFDAHRFLLRSRIRFRADFISSKY